MTSLDPPSDRIALYCDNGHERHVFICDLVRVEDGQVRESGYVHRYPLVWLLSNARSLERRGVGDKDPVTGLWEWYDEPSERTTLPSADEEGLSASCPKCSVSIRKDRSAVPWTTLTPLLDQVAQIGVSKLSLARLRSNI